MSKLLKPQWVRIADVILVGPLMAYGGYRLSKNEPAAGWSLAALGVSTMIYNAINYMRYEK